MQITEQIIDDIVIQLEKDSDYQSTIVEQFEKIYEDYLAYLDQDVLPLLNEEERDLLLFILAVIVEANMRTNKEINVFDLDQYFDAEEGMWASYEDNLKMGFRERITPIFEQIKEEDALAFVEDLLIDDDTVEGQEDEANFLSSTGRDIIWNVSAAFISTLII